MDHLLCERYDAEYVSDYLIYGLPHKIYKVLILPPLTAQKLRPRDAEELLNFNFPKVIKLIVDRAKV